MNAKNTTETGYGFGTFKGVFTPSILTILGVIMYLRFGWVLGQVGLPLTLLIATMATSITLLTGLSLATLATNMKVKGGGAYYIISRSLGLEAGAAIGVPLFFAQALGISFYIAGFTEALVGTYPMLNPHTVALTTLCLLTGLALISADLALKTQFIILALIGASLISFFVGRPVTAPLPANTVLPAYKSFWAVFAIFFPAVTGIEAGIAMSGDLKDPAKSLPRGTIGAVLTGYVVYMAIPVFLSMMVHDHRLFLTEPLILSKVARWGSLILYGVWAASLSSAMGSLLGAPRTLQALARDRILPHVLGRGFGPNNDPRIATLVTFGVALVGVLAGKLNLIAPVLTMFFLTSYGLLNVSAGLEQLIGSPSWRPRFRIPTAVPLCGAAACFAAMFMINSGATFAAAAVASLIYVLVKRRSLNRRWGDVRYGAMMWVVRNAIYKLSNERIDERSWKPNVLVIGGGPGNRPQLIELGDALAGEESCLSVAAVLPVSSWSAERVEEASKTIKTALSKQDIEALVSVLPAESLLAGAETLVQAYGFGPIRPNTFLLAGTEPERDPEGFAQLVQHIHQSRRNLILLNGEAGKGEEDQNSTPPRIDLWWRGSTHNIGLLLTLAYLIQRNDNWKESSICLKTIVEDATETQSTRTRLETLITEQRLEAVADVIERNGANAYELITSSSADAGLVLLGLRHPLHDESPDHYAEYIRLFMTTMSGLPMTAFVMSSEDISFAKIMGISD